MLVLTCTSTRRHYKITAITILNGLTIIVSRTKNISIYNNIPDYPIITTKEIIGNFTAKYPKPMIQWHIYGYNDYSK